MFGSTKSSYSAVRARPELGLQALLCLLLGCSSSQDGGARSAEALSGLGSCPLGSIDDLEDGNQQIRAHDGRDGYWYTYADEDGTTIAPDIEFEPTPGGARETQLAARVHGRTADQTNVWAGMALPFTNPKLPYDASKYAGIAFYARHAKGTTPVVKVRIPDGNTDPDGGVCTECWNDFGVQLVLTNAWTRYVLPFEELVQEPGWGDQKAQIETTKIYELRWQISTRNVDYDVWVDEIEFVGCNR